MKMLQRLKFLEGQYMFLKWLGGCEYVKLLCVNPDYVEVDIIDIESMEYKETMLLRDHLIMEATFGGPDVQRVLAEMSCNLPSAQKD